MINNLSWLERAVETPPLNQWKDNIFRKAYETVSNPGHRHLNTWLTVLNNLPVVKNPAINLNSGSISIDGVNNLTAETLRDIECGLRKFHPWRKGPYNIHGVHIDTEWKSDLKWDRLKNHIASLKDRTVLDVGCGNGYHCLKMIAEGAKLVIGIDPFLLYFMQFQVICHFLDQEIPIHHLPIGIDDLPHDMECFDTVFSMGVLYHRKSPIDHLMKISSLLKRGGELVLETLVVDGDEGYSLMPKDRYAKMRNVWFIPSISTVKLWLKRCGFKDITIIDVTKTSKNEQRSTDWMTFESLQNFLDPADENFTIEGYPAPKRAILTAFNSKL